MFNANRPFTVHALEWSSEHRGSVFERLCTSMKGQLFMLNVCESNECAISPVLAETAVVFRSSRLNRYSFLSLASSLEAHPETSTLPIFWVAESHGLEAFLHGLLRGHKTAVLCYSIMTPQWPEAKDEIARLAGFSLRKRVLVVAGGSHPSGAPKRTIESGVDAVCVGEGEGVFPRLLLATLGKEGLEEIPGLYFRRGATSHFTGHGSRPDWSSVPALPFQHGKFGPIEITRGCPFGCRYCQTPILKGKRVRHRSLRAILEAVHHLVAAKRHDIRFITPNALAYGSPDGRTLHLDALTGLLSGIRKHLPHSGRIFFGSFPSEVRPEFVTDESAELLRTHCDNRMVVLGAQSGSEEMLRRMRRGHDAEMVRRACGILLKHGLQPVVDFIVGLPHERLDQMLETISFMEELAVGGARLHAHTFVPLPGSPWGGLSPQPIPTAIRRRLEYLIAHGKLFGQWQRQEQMGYKAVTMT